MGPAPEALEALETARRKASDHHGFPVGDVPCNGCTRCCKGDALRLLPGDNPDEYLTEPHDFIPGALMLAHKANRECIYLGPSGCTIHDRRPLMCREMDCRLIAKLTTYTQARKIVGLPMPVWRKGRELLAVTRA